MTCLSSMSQSCRLTICTCSCVVIVMLVPLNFLEAIDGIFNFVNVHDRCSFVMSTCRANMQDEDVNLQPQNQDKRRTWRRGRPSCSCWSSMRRSSSCRSISSFLRSQCHVTRSLSLNNNATSFNIAIC